MRHTIADYEVVGPWPWAEHRYVCRAPRRLERDGQVMVSELAVDAEGWKDLCERLGRLASATPGGLLELIEVGPDLETGRVFLVTETAGNGTLARPREPLSPEARIAAVEAAARAAHALHEDGLAHGSIRPDSVLLSGRGPVLDLPPLDIADGEVVKIGEWPSLACLDPDLLRGEPPSRASDIWALGATLHLALSSRPLYPGIESDEPVTAVQRVMLSRPEPDPALPPRLVELIAACLAADPAERLLTAMAVAGNLARVEVHG